MLTLPPSTRVFVATKPADMRRGFDGLMALVRDFLGEDPLSGHLFVFRNRAGDRLKILWWDRDGLAIFYKRLEEGVFTFPSVGAGETTRLEMSSADLQGMIRELLTKLYERDRQLTGVQHQLDLLLKRLYGPKAERFDPNQPTLFDGCPPPPVDEATPQAAPTPLVATTPPAKQKPKRQKLPEHLRRERQEIDLSEAEKICPCCAQPRVRFGDEITELLDYVPAALFARQIVRFKYGCPACLKKRQAEANAVPPIAGTPLEACLPAEAAKLIVTAPLPALPIAKGLAGPGLLAHIIISKYVDHLPLHRQSASSSLHCHDVVRSVTRAISRRSA